LRIGIVADIHGNWTALQAVIPELQRLRVDAVAGLGDYLWTTTGDQAVVDWVMQACPGWFVRGNGDSMAYYERCKALAHQDPRAMYETVSALPERLVLDLSGYRVLLQHEWWPGKTDPNTTCERLRRPPCVSPEVDLTGIDVAVFGDSHLPHHYATADTLIVHPGAVGAPFDADPTQAKFALLDLGPDGVHLTHHAVPFDIHAANREIIEGRAVDINHSYYRKMTEIRLRITGEEYWAPVPDPVHWLPARMGQMPC
jgi:predicted phosphodiesterase